MKTFGILLVDTGLVKEAKVPQELWRVKDFASDLLVLQLASEKTVLLVLSAEITDPGSAFYLSSSLFFMRVHLFAVNEKRLRNCQK